MENGVTHLKKGVTEKQQLDIRTQIDLKKRDVFSFDGEDHKRVRMRWSMLPIRDFGKEAECADIFFAMPAPRR